MSRALVPSEDAMVKISMTKREFLKATTLSLISAMCLSNTCSPQVSSPLPTIHGLYGCDPNRTEVFGSGWQSVTAAAFHSNLWDLGASTGGYERLTLPAIRRAEFRDAKLSEFDSYSD